jgi:uncharacterized protein (DUF305 family)
MNKEPILYGIIGLLAGSLLTVVVATTAVNANNTGMMRMMGMHTSNQTNMTDEDNMHGDSSSMGMSMSMNDMTANLKGKTGDDFDKVFLSEMIVHHQGAIDMANLAKQNANHNEIKKLADDIVAAQTKEINEMKQWQKDWGYPTDDDSMGGMHSN